MPIPGGVVDTAWPPGAAAPAAWRARAAAALVALLAGCGGGDDAGVTRTATATATATAAATASRRQALAGVPAATVTLSNDKLFAWAQQVYPDLFGSQPPQAMQVPYQGRSFDVRFYAARGAYLGVADGEVFGLGAFTGGTLQSFGPVSAYAETVCARMGCGDGGKAGSRWTAVTGLPTAPCSGGMNGIVQGPSRWVAVGDSGCIRTSVDGASWLHAAQPFAGSSLLDTAWGAGRYVAVGTRGRILSSTDGLTWNSPVQTAAAAHLNAVVWLGDRFLAVGDRGGDGSNVHTSPDGVAWTPGAVTTDPTVSAVFQKLVAVAGNGSTVVAVGGATTNYTAWRSTDAGRTWRFVGSQRPGDGGFVLGAGVGEARATGVAWGNGRWVAVGAMGDWAVSVDDGQSWRTGRVDSQASVLVSLDRVAFDGQQFVAVGGQKRIYTSDDGQTWARRYADETLSPALVKGHFRAVGGTAAQRLVVVGTVDDRGGSGLMTSVP